MKFTMDRAIAFKQRWYKMLLCLFFKVDVWMVELKMTDSLSPNNYKGLSNGTPIILSVDLISIISSTAILAAMNSLL